MRLIILPLILAISCTPTYKKCNCESKDESQKAYSEIINQIIEHHTYNYYLGNEEERIFKAYVESRGDSSKIHSIDREVIRLQNKIYSDTARRCTIFLDTAFNRKFSVRISSRNSDTNTLKAISEISVNNDLILSSLSTIQTKYLPQDFTLCTSKMKLASTADSICKPCCIGTLQLSHIAFNSDKNKGLLYFEFVGWHGTLLKIEKVEDHWIIKNSIMIWIF